MLATFIYELKLSYHIPEALCIMICYRYELFVDIFHATC